MLWTVLVTAFVAIIHAILLILTRDPSFLAVPPSVIDAIGGLSGSFLYFLTIGGTGFKDLFLASIVFQFSIGLVLWAAVTIVGFIRRHGLRQQPYSSGTIQSMSTEELAWRIRNREEIKLD